jgi:hypothetical protein
LRWLYVWAFIYPLAVIYARGPRFHSVGMWAGADPSDVCAEMSGFSAKTWASPEQNAVCMREIARRFDAFVVSAVALVVAFALYHAVGAAWRHFVLAPLRVKRKVMIAEATESAKWRARIAFDSGQRLRPSRSHPFSHGVIDSGGDGGGSSHQCFSPAIEKHHPP